MSIQETERDDIIDKILKYIIYIIGFPILLYKPDENLMMRSTLPDSVFHADHEYKSIFII